MDWKSIPAFTSLLTVAANKTNLKSFCADKRQFHNEVLWCRTVVAAPVNASVVFSWTVAVLAELGPCDVLVDRQTRSFELEGWQYGLSGKRYCSVCSGPKWAGALSQKVLEV